MSVYEPVVHLRPRRGSDVSWRGSLQDLRRKIYSWHRPKKGVDEPLLCDPHRRAASGKETDKMDLFDLIARTQNSRIDDQRCELPGSIHKSLSISHLATEQPYTSDHDRVREMLQQKGPYPQVLDPLSAGYWLDGFVQKRQSDSDHMLRSANLDKEDYELLKSDAVNYYKEYFVGQEHQNYIAQDENIGQIILSVKRELQQDTGKLYRAILRTKLGTNHELLRSEDSSEPSVRTLVKLCNESVTTSKFYPVTSLEASTLISNFDERFLNKNFKFGVIYQGKGQTTEEQMFGNNVTTPAFNEFLELIGSRVNLQGFSGFRGGLDTLKGQTGAESIRTDYEGRAIMFHVSTLLPYTDGDSQQLQRKRHIGNDIVGIVFQEENTPFIPNAIASHFLHAYIIVQPVEACTKNARYKISVAARTDVPKDFGPSLPKSKVIRKEQLRDFLLTKLLNAEYACHNAPQFHQKMERTRLAYLTDLYDELLKSTLVSWCGMNSSANEKTAMSIFDSFKKMALKRISDNPVTYKKQNSSVSSTDGSKTPALEQKLQKLSYTDKKMHSDGALSSHASWGRNTPSYHYQRTYTECTSLSSFRSQSSYRTEQDNTSIHSDSPKQNGRPSPKPNGRSCSPTSLGSYGVDDEDAFVVHDDSDTGVGSMSPVETPNGTWESRLPQSKSFPNGNCSRCTSCDPDLDYIALLKREIKDLRSQKAQLTSELSSLRDKLNECSRKDNVSKSDIREKTKQNLRLQHQIDELQNQSQMYRNELSRLQAVVAGMSGEEIV